MSSFQPAVYDVIIIGAGLCGISCGAGLKTFGIKNFIILEKGSCCGYFWKCTYDRLHMHTPWHDLPYDKGLVYEYSKYKSRAEVVSYCNKYAKLHQLSPHIQYHSNVTNINKITADSWTITYTNGLKPNESNVTISAKYLVIATSQFRSPSIPNNLSQTMDNFSGEIMHSIQYKNASKYKNNNILVVGNGNTGCEVCIDAVEHGANKVTMVSRRARHFIPLTSYEKGPFRQMIIAKYLGLWDVFHASKIFRVTKTHPKFKENLKVSSEKYKWMSVDMSEYGISKPKLSFSEETLEGNYQVMDTGFIDLVKSGRVKVINKGGVQKFGKAEIVMENGEVLKDKYELVVLCTGYRHGLEELFEKRIFCEYFYDGTEGNKCKLYPRYQIYPKTNGRSRSLNDKSLYFAAFDQGITAGLARGLIGWDIARHIAKDEEKYDKKMELWHWNYMNTRVVCGVAGAICILVIAFFIP